MIAVTIQIPSRYHVGLILHKLHKTNEAIKEFTKVLELTCDTRVLESRGLCYQELQMHESAIKVIFFFFKFFFIMYQFTFPGEKYQGKKKSAVT